MMIRIKQVGLVLLGVLAGVLLSLNFSAVAQRDSGRFPLPVDELRAFADVFGAIKTNYVEPVEDKKLITEAISGMLTGLDPHSAYLDQDAFRELQVGTQGEFGGLGIEVGMEDGFVKVVADADTDDILGVHMIGPHVTDNITEAALAQVLNATPWEVGQTIHPHPTLSEALGEAMLAVDGMAISG